MIYRKDHLATVRTAALMGVAAAALITSPAFAQDALETTAQSAADIADDDDKDQIVVTGSRLRQSSFTSPSPLTVLNVEENRQLGITSIAEMVGRSTIAAGAQIDSTFNSNAGNANATEAPPTGGVGSTNINLRGLGPERTLILLNGRRLAATGVRGAPSQPDVSLIPFAMVKSFDILTEAGSSVYGADAVAGVANVILRDDFEGFEISGTRSDPLDPGGEITNVSMIMGAQNDRASIVFGAEYFNRNKVTANTRDYAATLRDIEIDENGNIIEVPFQTFFDNNGFDQNFNIVCRTPGTTGAGQPTGFSNCSDLTPPPGFRDLGSSNFGYFDEYNDNRERGQSDLVGNSERFSIMTTGKYDLDLIANEEVYFEAFYFNRQNFATGTLEQIFPTVTGLINEVDANGAVIGQVDNPFNPFPGDFIPILTLDDIPQTRDVELQQIRLVGGMRGDISAGWFGENNWRWDAYGSYDRGTGFVSQPILFQNNLIAALQPVLNPDGTYTCSSPTAPDIFGFLVPENCVPVNLFAESIFTGGANGNGAFSTDAERDFLISNRTNRTAIDQYVFSAFIDGTLMQSPWGGDVNVGFGYEYRKDVIDSANSLDGVRRINAAENAVPEGETRGARSFNEWFGEISIPLIQDMPGIELLQFDASLRQTKESNFGSGTTYRLRGQYQPVSWVSLSGGYGTSFRAPNLRESFLADQGGGVSGAGDPCHNINIQQAVAAAANGDADTDVQFLIANCSADGVPFTDTDNNGFLDATVLGTQGTTTIPTFTGGNNTLKPERSRTFTLTASIDQPWYDQFSFRLATSYFDISITDSIEEPSFANIVGNCYQNTDFPNLTSPFCSLISRATGPNAATNLINGVDVTFFNIGEITSKGLDMDAEFGIEAFSMQGKPVDLTLRARVTRLLEQEQQTFLASDRDDNLGEIGIPKWRANFGTRWDWNDFTLVTDHRFIGSQQQDATDGNRPNPFIVAQPLSHDVDFVNSVWYHDVAVTYSQDSWDFTIGMNNVFDKTPPLIDDGEGPNRNNAVTSSGYDFFGRRIFATVRKSF